MLNFPILLGSHRAKPSEWARLPSAKSRFLGGCPLGRNHDPKGGVAEAERRSAAGRRNGPEAVTKQKAGYIAADAHETKVLVGALAVEVQGNRLSIRAALSGQEQEAILTEFLRRLAGFAVSNVLRDREGEAAALAANVDIDSPMGTSTIP